MFKVVLIFADGDLESAVTLNHVSSFSYHLGSNLFAYRYGFDSCYRSYRLDDILSIEIHDIDINNQNSLKGDLYEG